MKDKAYLHPVYVDRNVGALASIWLIAGKSSGLKELPKDGEGNLRFEVGGQVVTLTLTLEKR